jgi:WD40 repeat protein
MQFSPDGKTLAAGDGSVAGRVHLIDAATDKVKATLADDLVNYRVFGLAYQPDGKALATVGLEAAARIWDPATGKQTATLDWKGQTKGQQAYGRCVAYSPDGKLLATGGDDHKIRIWDVAAEKEVRTLEGHKGSVFAVAFAKDGKLLASASGDGDVRLWDPATGEAKGALEQAHKGGAAGLAFSPDGKTLVTGGQDRGVRLWDVAAAKELHDLKWEPDVPGPTFIQCVAFAPDGKTVASGGKACKVRLWDVATGKEVAALWGDRFLDMAMAFSPDGKTLAVGGQQGTLHFLAVPKDRAGGAAKGEPAKDREPPAKAQGASAKGAADAAAKPPRE